jgi:hypothetical protein
MEIHCIELCKAPSSPQPIHAEHRYGVLEIAFAAARDTASRQQRSARNHASSDLLVLVALQPSIVIGERAEVEVACQDRVPGLLPALVALAEH